MDRPAPFGAEASAEQVELSETRVKELDEALALRQFPEWSVNAERIATMAGVEQDDLTSRESQTVRQLVARVEREFMRRFVHILLRPGERFDITDPQLMPPAVTASPLSPASDALPPHTAMSLKRATSLFLERKKADGVGTSHISETKRVLDWLEDALGDRPLDAIAKEEMRGFRDSLERLDGRLGGKAVSFQARQTAETVHRIAPVTAARYRNAVQMFFKWAAAELSAPDVAAGLKTAKAIRAAPDPEKPFTRDEVRKLLTIPLYAGHRDRRHPTFLGAERSRGSLWWSGLIGLHTGMRAGEIAQLTASDYVFDAPIPHIRIAPEAASVGGGKRVKNAASVREVPIAPVLLTLGLREFVQARAHRGRVMFDIALGKGDRRSDGLTKAWGRILRQSGLHKSGRGTHVWRHTVAATLREAGVSDEESGRLLGHKPTSVTGQYGKTSMPDQKLGLVGKIDYGLDLVEALGGAFDAKRHWA